MLVLGIDTSWKHGGIALVRDADELGCAPLQGGTFSAQLVPQIAALLAEHRLRKEDLDGFAAVSGPGSFTGLRVGLAAVKALAEVLQKPIATVTVLEALAVIAVADGRVVTALDAGRNEVFVGEYQVQDGAARRLREEVQPQPDFAASVSSAGRVITPDESILKLLRERSLSSQLVKHPTAADAARIGLRKILAGQTVSPDQLDANYIRRSDAELFSPPKQP